MTKFRMNLNQIVAVNGVRHEYLGDDLKGRAQFRNHLTLGTCNFKKDVLLKMYSTGTFRFLTFGESYDSVTIDRLPIIVEDLQTLPQAEFQQVRRKAAYVTALNSVKKGDRWEIRVKESIHRTAVSMDDKKPPSVQTIYRWRQALRNWDGDVRVLAPANHRKGNAHSKIHPEILEILERKIKTLYLRPNPMTLKDVHEAVLAEIFSLNKTRSSADLTPLPVNLNYKTVRARVEKLSPYTITKAHHGNLAGERIRRGGGTSVIVARPLQRAEIDHTQLDVFLVDEKRLPLGRPYLTAIIDVYSRAILGFHVSFRAPSQHAIFECLRMAIAPKSFLKEPGSPYVGIRNEWPMHGIPVEIAHDAGKDFLGKSFADAAFELGIQLNQLPVLRPWLKGTVERAMGTMNRGTVGGAPGHTLGKNHNQISDRRYNAKRDAVLTFQEFLYLLVHWIVDIYHETPHSTTLEKPVSRWLQGIEEFPPRMPSDIRHLNTVLAHRREGTITESGIWMLSLNYNSPELTELRDSLGDDRKVAFKFNESDLSKIFIHSSFHRRYIEATCRTPAVVQGLSFFQFCLVRKRAQRQAGQYNNASIENLIAAKQEHFALIESAAHSTRYADRRAGAVAGGVESKLVTEIVSEGHISNESSSVASNGTSLNGKIANEAGEWPQSEMPNDLKNTVTAQQNLSTYSANEMSQEAKAKLLAMRKKA